MRTLTPILFLVVAGCFGANAKQGEPKKGEKVAEVKEAKIVRPGHPVTFDGVKVELVAYDGSKFIPPTIYEKMAIIKLTNLTKSEIINFKSFLKDESIVVTDEFGNRYKTFMKASSGGRIDPDESREEPIYFEVPQKNSKEITFAIPCENFGRKGNAQCKLPITFFSGKTK